MKIQVDDVMGTPVGHSISLTKTETSSLLSAKTIAENLREKLREKFGEEIDGTRTDLRLAQIEYEISELLADLRVHW